MGILLSPLGKLFSAVFVSILCAGLSVHFALKEKKIEYKFSSDVLLESSHGQIELKELDFTPEPNDIVDHHIFSQFLERQKLIVEILEGESIKATQDGVAVLLSPQKKMLSDLGLIFWIPIIVGTCAVIISSWVWVMNTSYLPGQLFMLSGFSMMISAFPSAIYTSRILAIHSSEFYIFQLLNGLGACLFGIAMLALFSLYPARLPHARKWLVGLIPLLGIWTTLGLFRKIPGEFGINLIIVSEMTMICLALLAQYLYAKENLYNKAILKWIGLSFFLGAGLFILMTTVPILLNRDAFEQSYSFAFFLIIYLGIAAGITKFKIFEVETWAFKIIFYFFSAIFFIAIDAFLIFALNMERLPALGFALLAIGFIYLPLRDYMWKFFVKTKRIEFSDLVKRTLDVAMSPTTQLRYEKWRELLTELFSPMNIKVNESGENISGAVIVDNGLGMIIPSFSDIPSLHLKMAMNGKSLFSTTSLQMASQVLQLITYAEENRQSYDRGVMEERKRVAQDLHDDIGAKILTAIHLSGEELKPLLQDTLADIRTMVSNVSGEKNYLQHSVAEIRYEANNRLATVGIRTEWEVGDDDFSQMLLSYEQKKSLHSAIRETITNVIKHAQASEVKIKIELVDGERVVCEIKDNGIGKSAQNNSKNTGMGLQNIQARMKKLNGEAHVEQLDCGTLVFLQFPLKG